MSFITSLSSIKMNRDKERESQQDMWNERIPDFSISEKKKCSYVFLVIDGLHIR